MYREDTDNKGGPVTNLNEVLHKEEIGGIEPKFGLVVRVHSDCSRQEIEAFGETSRG